MTPLIEDEIPIDRIVRSRRRTVGLEIGMDARLVVRAPWRAPLHFIRRVVESKRGWIERKQSEMLRKGRQFAGARYEEGSTFLFLGQAYPLVVSLGTLFPLSFSDACFLLNSSRQNDAPALFAAWYRSQAEAVILPRVERLAGRFGIPHDRVRINNARRRWGSCCGQGRLGFSWRLVMAPPEVIDYVVLHELAHVMEKNHSRRFWRLVESMQPDCRLHRRWLHDHSFLCLL